MEHFFNTVHITNFKSLKDVTLSDCKRINLLIGKPNVGKSNILEAIGLFSLPYFEYDRSQKLDQFVRLENLTELFFDGNKENLISINADTGDYCTLEYLRPNERGDFGSIILEINLLAEKDSSDFALHINNEMNISYNTIKKNKFLGSKVKYYKFAHDIFYEEQDRYTSNIYNLMPPVGINLVEIIQKNKETKKEFIELFKEYDLKFLFDKGSDSLRIMKETKDGEVFSLPYKSIADTLQRLIFFKTAIGSNKDSILLFEEPEAHCFPPYIAYFTQQVIRSETNQFFIATHSPYVLNDFLEYQRDDVAIFIADFKDGQTVVNRLSDDEVNEVYDYGIDVFFNYERFTHHDG